MIRKRRTAWLLGLVAGLMLQSNLYAAARRTMCPRPRSSATPAWPGGARPNSACSSTGASMPFPPARTTASRSKGIGEWIMNSGKIPVARYAEYAKEFNPVKFNAEQWVKIAKDAGMKYIVITSKHHDGFAMFHSKAEPLQHLRCHALQARSAGGTGRGLQEGRHQARLLLLAGAGLAPSRRGRVQQRQAQRRQAGGHWDPAQDGSMDEYIDKVAVPQVREILTNYGDFPAVLWWDTPKDMTPERADETLQGRPGTPAQHHHEQPPGRRLPGRHRNPRAAHPRRRLSRTATGKPA